MNYNYGYDYGYEAYNQTATNAATGILAGIGVYMIFMFALAIFMIVCMWKIFKKAGKQGWEAIIPIYNIIVLLEIVNLPGWYIVLFIIPIANIYAMFKIYIELAHKFGKSTGFGIATVFFSIICLPILAFGNNNYNGNGSFANTNYQQPTNYQPQPINNYSIENNSQTIGAVGMNQTEHINTTAVPQPTTSNVKYCSNCGTQNDINALFCASCGNKF